MRWLAPASRAEGMPRVAPRARLAHAPAPQTPCASPPASSCHPRSARRLATAHAEQQDGACHSALEATTRGASPSSAALRTRRCVARAACAHPRRRACDCALTDATSARRAACVSAMARPATVRTPWRHGRSACSRKPATQLCASTQQRRRAEGCWCWRCLRWLFDTHHRLQAHIEARSERREQQHGAMKRTLELKELAKQVLVDVQPCSTFGAWARAPSRISTGAKPAGRRAAAAGRSLASA
jgi:hypothetical protein